MRLSKAKRREQLLDVALGIVADSGADALTLGSLAERAGVSKPIAYEHFGTRSGLLIDLYRRIDERQVTALRSALARAPTQIDAVARIMADATMACASSGGPEWYAIAAALKGDPEMDRVQQELEDSYVDLCRDALPPFSTLRPADLRLCCAGLVGAGDAIAREMTRGRTTRARATNDFTAIIVRAICG